LKVARGFEGEARRAAAEQAEAMFREIDTRVPCLPTGVVRLAESLALQEDYLGAAEQYRRVLDARRELEKYKFWRDSLSAAEAGLSTSLSRIGTVVIASGKHSCAKGLPSASLGEHADVKAPASAFRSIDMDTELGVNPKSYEVRVEAAGCRPFTQTVAVPPGQSVSVLANLEPPPAQPPDDRKRPPPSRCLGMPPWVCVAGAVAVVGIGVGVGVGIYAANQGQSEKPAPATFNCASTGATLGCTTLE
jgi:hypothetical protein